MSEGTGMEHELKRQIDELNHEKAALPRKYGTLHVPHKFRCSLHVKSSDGDLPLHPPDLLRLLSHSHNAQAHLTLQAPVKVEHRQARGEARLRTSTARCLPRHCRAQAPQFLTQF
jgi:hypothetical protein